ATPVAERYGGTAVVAGLGELTALNEITSPDYDSDQVMAFVLFTTLVRYDENLQPVPYLAERWDTVRLGPDAIALTFHLRRDVRWHDGVPTTAHDVKFTFDRARDPAYAYPNPGFFTFYDSARVADDYTITFFLRPHSEFMDVWRAVSPMPRHILGDVGPREMRTHPFNTQEPVGNGPFRFVSHTSQDRWVFEANPDFPEGLGGRPYLDRLVYRVIPEESTLLTEFLTGRVHVSLLVLPEHAGRLEADPEARLLSFPSRQYVFLAWNGRRPPFESADVRRALAYAIDRRRIVDAVRSGYGIVAHGPIPPFHWAYDPDLEPLGHAPDSARALLDRAGWTDEDGDGVRERDGEPLRFEIKTNQNRQREDILQLIQADLAKVGVQVRPRVLEWSTFVEDVVQRREFDAFILGLVTEFRMDDSDLFACDRRDGPYQFAYYCNPRVDSILARAPQLARREEALPLWHEYQRILTRDQPFHWLYYEVRPVGVRARLHGVRMDIRGTWISAREWWIAPEDRVTPEERTSP
ncbi:MAG: ABC transporter substrate-binding protein, partial [Gemmatimonadota bacterium]